MSASALRSVVRIAAAILLLVAPMLADCAAARSIRSSATPVGILTGIYREAVKGTTSDWLEPDRRGQYLSKSLLALWARSDAQKPPQGEAGPIDFDLTTDTNALELESFAIKPQRESATAATLAVRLTYRKPFVRHDPAIVLYDFVREDGRWRIDDFRTKAWSARELLQRWLDDPPAEAQHPE